MHATEYVAAEGPFEAKRLPQTGPARTAEPPHLLAVFTRWRLVKKNGGMALNTLLGDKEFHYPGANLQP
jgi:hypothetical protein